MEKSDKEGDTNQAKEYLGFIIDTNSMTVRLQEAKKQRILQQVSETISRIEIVPSQRISRDYRENSSNGTGTRADSCNSTQGFLRNFRGGHTTERMEFVVGDE